MGDHLAVSREGAGGASRFLGRRRERDIHTSTSDLGDDGRYSRPCPYGRFQYHLCVIAQVGCRLTVMWADTVPIVLAGDTQ